MEHTRLFFAAFGDELSKIAQGGQPSKAEMAKILAAGLGGGAIALGGLKAAKDWERGRKQRIREAAMRDSGGMF